MVENLEGLFVRYIQRSLSLNFSHLGDHAMFLKLDITINEGNFIYSYFIKQIWFPFPLWEWVIKKQYCFKYFLFSEFLRLSPSRLCIRAFIPEAKGMWEVMKKQGFKQNATSNYLEKIILPHPESLQQLSISVFHLSGPPKQFPEEKP